MPRSAPRLPLIALVPLCLLTLVGSVLGQTVSFSPQREFAVGNGPFWVTAGDFNDDGLKDLATSNRASNDVSVLLGNGDGTFQAARSFSAGGGASYVGVGDFNRDGIQDLATADYNAGTISVLRGLGDGTFLAPQSFPAGGINPNCLAVGDFNGDGTPDMAVAVFGANEPNAKTAAVLLGTGTGTFLAAQTNDAERGPLWVELGDFNGDAQQDLALANFGADTVSVLLGNGDGTFQTENTLPGGACSFPPCGAAAVVVADFNSDGLQDLGVVDYRSYELAVLPGNGDGTFGAPVAYSTGTSPATAVVADFTGEGVPDLAVPNWDFNTGNTLSLLVGNGDGTFAPARTVAVLGGRGVLGVVAADFNGDAVPDLAVSNYAGNTVAVLINASGPPAGVSLTVNKTGAGSGTVTSSPAGINCGATCSAVYNSGTVVALTASAAGGSTFNGWSGGGCSGTGTCSVTMSAAATITASFTAQPQQFTLTVNKAGTGSGAVTSSPSGINCGATCSAVYSSGTGVALTASAAGGSTFNGWSGGGCSGTGTCSVTMSAATTVTASFTVQPQQFTLTVGKAGTGSGTVTSNPAGINCGATCSAVYNTGTVVTLTASTAGGSTFSGWTGGGCSGTGTCSVTMNAATTVTASFTAQPQQFTLTVNKAGTGSGTVTSSPVGINCGATCSAAYNSGTVVTLTASAAGGSTFSGWSGGSCSGTGTCSVTMSAATTVTATFSAQPQQFTLTIAKAGTGSGTVTSSPAGINCGATCSAAYNSGTVVTLTASAAGGSTFSGWSGGSCSGTGTCSVTMSAATTVTATFSAQPQQFTLTIAKAGTGSGTVTSSPAGINCGATCSAVYNSGTAVTLTASTAGGSTFSGWSGGGCSGTGTCSVTMTAAATVTATFGAAIVSAPTLKWQYGGCITGPYCDTGWYSSPAVADLDADGRPEVIWGAYDVVALNGADGSQKWRAASPNRVWPAVAVADLTGDGTLEVVVGRSSDQLTVYNRTGGVVWTRNPFGNGEVRSLAVADLEADGQLEIVVGHAGDPGFQLNVFQPNGSVRSGWPARHSGDPGYGSGLFNENVAVADVVGGGFKQVFGPASAHYITALDRNGNQLSANAVYNNISPAGPKVWSQVGVHVDNAVDLRGFANCGAEHRPDFSHSAPVIADLNGDGVSELVVVGSVYNCGTDPYTDLHHVPFILKRDRTRWSDSGFDWTVVPTPGAGSAPRSLDYDVIENAVPNAVVADLDGDGFKEILYPSYDGKVHAYWLDKTEHGSWPYRVPTSGAAGDDFRFASEPVVADLNNDGRAEVLFTSWPKQATGRVGQLHILSYLGVELHRMDLPAAALDASWNGGLAAPTLSNIDADADLEVVVGTVGSGVVAYDLPNTAGARVLWGTGRGSLRRAGTTSP